MLELMLEIERLLGRYEQSPNTVYRRMLIKRLSVLGRQAADMVAELMLEDNQTRVRINGTVVEGLGVAYDGCHKLYILEDVDDMEAASEKGYRLYDLTRLKELWDESCPLRFIHNWELDKTYIAQGENGRIEGV